MVGRTSRFAVRVGVVDAAGPMLLMSTRDAGNPDFGTS